MAVRLDADDPASRFGTTAPAAVALVAQTAEAAAPQPSAAQSEWRSGARQKAGARRVVVFGAGAIGCRFVRAVHAQPERKLRILGVFDDRVASGADRVALTDVTGTSDDLLRFAQARRVDEIVVALPRDADSRLRQVVEKLCALPASITAYDGAENGGAADGLPSLRRRVLLPRQHDKFYWRIKSAVDLLLGALTICVTLPLMLLIALAIKIDSPGPVLFCQQRYGYKGRVFRLYKFRTLRRECADPLGVRQAHLDDERVTRIGAMLRRTHLDELPQLLNVLKGDMALVGPRPHPIGMRTEGRLCHELIPYYFSRYRVKPGMTGWAQVNGCRGPTRMAFQLQRRVDHDLYYIGHCTLWFDMKILALTLGLIRRSEEELRASPAPVYGRRR